jgi:hypothetical protein
MSNNTPEIKVLSFDVGIKNLSYCILTRNNDQYKIHNWGIINLTEDIIKEKNETDIDNDFLINYKKMKIQDLKNYMNTYGLETNKIRKDLIISCEEFLKKNKVLKLNKCKTMSLSDIGKVLYLHLDKYPYFNQVDYIVIENQPVLKNPTMKSIQIMIFSYFLMKNFVNNDNNVVSEIKLISARNKLKIYNGPDITNQFQIKNKYALTKKLAIEYCKYMIKHDQENYNFFINHTKKDDLADSFLQGAYFINTKFKSKKK